MKKGDKMRKRKLYIDTSIVSYLQQDDALEKTKITLKFWEEIKQAKYDIYAYQKY